MNHPTDTTCTNDHIVTITTPANDTYYVGPITCTNTINTAATIADYSRNHNLNLHITVHRLDPLEHLDSNLKSLTTPPTESTQT